MIDWFTPPGKFTCPKCRSAPGWRAETERERDKREEELPYWDQYSLCEMFVKCELCEGTGLYVKASDAGLPVLIVGV